MVNITNDELETNLYSAYVDLERVAEQYEDEYGEPCAVIEKALDTINLEFEIDTNRPSYVAKKGRK